VAREAIALGIKALWLQLGIVNDVAAKEAECAGIWVIQDKCLKVEHAIHA
jgi:predicted CoA-binding protein